MPTFYLDPVNGNDAADGSTFALTGLPSVGPWKTITGGATAARIAPGDEIRISKTPDPVNIGSCTWTKDSASVTIPEGTVLDICTCESNWTQSANITAALNSTYFVQGAAAVRLTPGAAFTTGLAGYIDVSTLDLSDYQKVSCWVRGSNDISAGTWRLDLCTNADGTGAVHSFTFNKAFGLLGMFFTFDNGGALNSAIKSIALTALSDPGTVAIYIDNIIATNNLCLGSVIGKTSSGPWFPIRCITGSSNTVVLGTITSSGYGETRKSPQSTQTCTSYFRESHNAWGSDYSIVDSGTREALITFKGGYNTLTGICDGETWLNNSRTALFSVSSKYFLALENIHSIHGSFITGIGGGDITIKNCSVAGGTALLSMGNYTLYRVTLQGTVVITCSEYGVMNWTVGSSGINSTAAIDVYGYGNSGYCFYIQGYSHRFIGKVRIYLNDENLAGALCLDDGLAYFRDLEIYDGRYAIGYGSGTSGKLRIDKLTVGAVYSLGDSGVLGVADIDYLSGDAILGGVSLGGRISVNHFFADNRYKTWFYEGDIMDHVTGGQAESWAYDGSGLSLMLKASTSVPLEYPVYLPVVANTSYSLHFQVRGVSGGTGIMTLCIRGCGITPIDDESVSYTTNWGEHTSASFTPTRDGFVEAVFRYRSGVTTPDIGIDEIQLQMV